MEAVVAGVAACPERRERQARGPRALAPRARLDRPRERRARAVAAEPQAAAARQAAMAARAVLLERAATRAVWARPAPQELAPAAATAVSAPTRVQPTTSASSSRAGITSKSFRAAKTASVEISVITAPRPGSK